TLAVCNVVDDALAPLVVGQDPTQIEQLVDRMHRTLMIWGRRGLAMMAVSGVELALWDLAGKARGVPVYQLIGGLCPPGRRACAPPWACRSPAARTRRQCSPSATSSRPAPPTSCSPASPRSAGSRR